MMLQSSVRKGEKDWKEGMRHDEMICIERGRARQRMEERTLPGKERRWCDLEEVEGGGEEGVVIMLK